MLIFATMAFVLFTIYANKEIISVAKVLPIAALIMVLYSFIPFLVTFMVLYSKGFYDAVGQWFAFVFATLFLIAWVHMYIATEEWVRNEFYN